MTHIGGRRVRLGVEAENMGSPAIDPGIVAMARAAEEAGVDSITVSEHLLSFTSPEQSASSGLEETWLDPLTCLAAISSVTTRARLIASVIILPQRNLLELLKAASTLNHLAKGRLVLGVGAGWNQREMEALGFDFASRGRRMDEMLEVMRGVEDGRVPGYAGQNITVPEGVVMVPFGDLPIYVGGSGTSKVSIRRALAFGDGWMPYSRTGGYDADALRQTLAALKADREAIGHPPLDTVFKLHVSGHADPLMERNVAELAALGFQEIVVQGVWDAGIEPGLEVIQRARQVLDA